MGSGEGSLLSVVVVAALVTGIVSDPRRAETMAHAAVRVNMVPETICVHVCMWDLLPWCIRKVFSFDLCMSRRAETMVHAAARVNTVPVTISVHVCVLEFLLWRIRLVFFQWYMHVSKSWNSTACCHGDGNMAPAAICNLCAYTHVKALFMLYVMVPAAICMHILM